MKYRHSPRPEIPVCAVCRHLAPHDSANVCRDCGATVHKRYCYKGHVKRHIAARKATQRGAEHEGSAVG